MSSIDRLKTIHGNIHEYLSPCRGYLKSAFLRTCSSIDYPIDFVVSWVDGNDITWKQERAKYLDDDKDDNNGIFRYRDWDIFQYWFRTVEKYAPWVNHIYLLTSDQIPKWLNIDSPKLTVVDHKDYIPAKYLPTFSSIPIELNMWRIQELSEHFVYFNDDMFLTAPVVPEDFFGGELPKYTAVAIPIANYSNTDAHSHQLFGNIGLVNANFNIRACMVRNAEKWFAKCYGSDRKYNKRVFHDNYLAGMEFTHLACPYRKSTCERVWNILAMHMDRSSSHKFRAAEDVMHQIFQLWEICEGSFYPIKRDYYGERVRQALQNIDLTRKVLAGTSNKMICLNDNESISNDDFERLQPVIKGIFDQFFPDKSEYEL